MLYIVRHCESVFPFLFGGTFIEGYSPPIRQTQQLQFPFLFGGTFIEGRAGKTYGDMARDFPSFSEGLSLRGTTRTGALCSTLGKFPFLFGGTFIEGHLDWRGGTIWIRISLPFRRDFH